MTQGAIESLIMLCKCMLIGGIMTVVAILVDKWEERRKKK